MTRLVPLPVVRRQRRGGGELLGDAAAGQPVDKVWRSPARPSSPAGMVLTVDFTLGGQRFQGLNGGPDFTFNEAVSFVIECDDQAEVDRLWDELTATAASPARAAGSRTASGCRGRSCPAG